MLAVRHAAKLKDLMEDLNLITESWLMSHSNVAVNGLLPPNVSILRLIALLGEEGVGCSLFQPMS